MRVRPVKSGGFSPFLVLRPSRLRHRAGGTPAPRSGYTLVEILIATTLALMLMAAVARMFGQLGTSVSNSRATLETLERLRETAVRMQMDLDGVTVTMLPPRPVANGEGYLEYIEGSYNAAQPVNNLTGGSDSSMTLSTSWVQNQTGTVGQQGDILMFTTRNSNRPFSGQLNGATIQSETAEVAWFLRGHMLHRRVLLVAPGATLSLTSLDLDFLCKQRYLRSC